MEAKREFWILEMQKVLKTSEPWKDIIIEFLQSNSGERGVVGGVPICFFEPGISNMLAEMLGKDVKPVKVLPTFMHSMKCGKRHDKDCLDVC